MTISAGALPGATGGARERIMVVDDEAAMRRAVAEILGGHGYEVVCVATGEEALERIGEVDLVLLDGMLPGRDGWEVCAQIKTSFDPLLPVIMVTGLADPEVVARTFRVGADDYVAKPFRSIELLARIESRLRVLRAERALRESEERYRQLYERNALMLFSVAADGTVRLVNENGAQQLGYTIEELLGTSVLDVFHPDDREAAREHLRTCLAQPERVHHWELRKMRRDGGVIWVRETAHAMAAPDGEPMASISCIDITERMHAAEAIEHSEARFRSMIENAAELIVVLAADGRITYASPANERIVGYAPAELEGRRAFEFVHVDDRPAIERAFLSLLQAPGRSVTVDFRFQHADGEWRILETTGTSLLHEPAVGGVVINARDVTERVRTERALTRSVTQLRGLAQAAVEVGALHAVDDVIRRITRHAGTLVGTRQAAAVVQDDTLRAVAAVRGADGVLREAPPQEPLCDALCEHVRRTNRPLRLSSEEVVRHPAGLGTRDGAADPAGAEAPRALCGWLGAPLVDARGGNLGAVYVCDKLDGEFSEADEAVLVQLARMASVAVENARLYTELEEAEQRYRRFFEDDLTGDYISTPDGQLLECNPAYARILGYASVQEALADSMLSIYPTPEDREALLERVRQERVLEEVEVELRRRDGERVHVIENVVGIFDDAGALVQIKGYLFDITERKQLEAQFLQSQKMEVVGKLAGGVAHDFNNLLTVIRGNTALLLQDMPPDSASHGDLEEIERAALRAGELTQQLLAFSRRQVLMPKVVDLNGTVGEMDKMLRRLIGEDIELITVLDPELAPVRVDPGQLQQVLMNLVVNARDAMPQGGTLVLETANLSVGPAEARRLPFVAPGAYVTLSVRDTGCGMAEEVQRQAFEPFYTTKEQGKGTGLGLSTVYGIVRQSGGYIELQSAEGQGSTFRIFLPRVRPPREAPPPAAERPPEVRRGRETILLVEDEDAVRDLALRILRQRGYRVLSASSGDEALRLADTHEGAIQLLVSDVVMPRLGGPATAARLRDRFPELRVVFISGYTDDAVMRHGTLGDTHFLQKPFSPEQLARAVRAALDA